MVGTWFMIDRMSVRLFIIVLKGPFNVLFILDACGLVRSRLLPLEVITFGTLLSMADILASTKFHATALISHGVVAI